jgi:hypothetical protein
MIQESSAANGKQERALQAAFSGFFSSMDAGGFNADYYRAMVDMSA